MAVLGLGGVLAAGLGEDPFGCLRLFAYGLFVYVPLVAAAASFAMWRPARKSACALAAVALLLVGVAVDAFVVEPHWLEVTRCTITSAKLHRRLKMIIVADLQTDQVGNYERQVLERVMAEKPDLVVMAGDYLHEWNERRRGRLQSELRLLLAETDFRAPLGTYAVAGNTDAPDWPGIFSGSHVTCIEQTRSIDLDDLRITGLSMLDSKSRGTRVGPCPRFHIALGHYPNFALGPVEADLLVAGHTHGGQVRFPWLGPLVTLSLVPRSWAAGMTPLASGRTLIVSRGIGMERGNAPRLRFLCRPQLVVVDLVPGESLPGDEAGY